jgi:hypothetical protein
MSTAQEATVKTTTRLTDVITTADKLACAKRELAMRRNAYGQAAHQLACMEAIVRDYEDALVEEAVP